jgi:acetyl-CoA acyltransferase
MTKQIQEAYIVAATRTPVGKAPRGMFRNTRPDDLLAQAPSLDPAKMNRCAIRFFSSQCR